MTKPTLASIEIIRYGGKAHVRSSQILIGAALTAAIACGGSKGTNSPTAASTATGSTTGPASGSGASGSSSTGGASSGSTSGGRSSSGTSSGGSTSAGSTTGFALPEYVDGGYVRCTAQAPNDAGAEDVQEWECNPGTYFCGTQFQSACSQCLSDADCANRDLPTFDLQRPRCDLHSGVAGYQGFCQQCLDSADCTRTSSGLFCNLDPTDVQPPIETLGFETCTTSTPPGCPAGTVPGLRGCVSSTCSSDSDCADAFGSSQELTPYCMQGTCQTAPSGSACPHCTCETAGVCGSPGSLPLTCDSDTATCTCSTNSQCGSAWPLCLFPDGGDAGICGCQEDSDCGDAGLLCTILPPSDGDPGGPACIVGCDDAFFPGCSQWSSQLPICNSATGLCAACGSDNDCQAKAKGPNDGPYCRLDGVCGCAKDSDCPHNVICQDIDVESMDGTLLGYCANPPQRCTPASCSDSHCALDSGTCLPGCLVDEDCWSSSGTPFCELDGGFCVQCRGDPDCVAIDALASTTCDPSTFTCQRSCATDANCVGNVEGPACLPSISRCGCGRDADCADTGLGPHCDTTQGDPSFGTCTCTDTSECALGQACSAINEGYSPFCTTACFGDAGCPSGFFCDSFSRCRPRCDPGHLCQPPDSICDVNDIAGQNQAGVDGGADAGGLEPIIWCYACLKGDDCAAGDACAIVPKGFDCGPVCEESLGTAPSCASGQVCLGDNHCHQLCNGGTCPAGDICDVDNLVLSGSNICYECLGPSDCSDGAGCNPLTHSCGTCIGPNSINPLSDCPPDAVCSNYWQPRKSGVCLQNCDFVPCSLGQVCAMLPDLSQDHRYCFACLGDADCAAFGAGYWCDSTVNLTFTCQPPPT